MRVPKLRRHKSGHYFVHWGGQDHYLGKNKADADQLYLDQLAEWREWWAGKLQDRGKPKRPRYTIAEVASKFLEAKRSELGQQGEYNYRKQIKRFVKVYGDMPITWIEPKHLHKVKSDLLGQRLAPKTINHVLGGVRTMMRWAGLMDYCDQLDWSAVRNIPLGPIEVDHADRADVLAGIRRAPEYVRPYMAVQYLALLRPSEVLRVVNGEGRFVEHGIFRLDKGKMDRRVSMKRHAVLSDEALGWLAMAEPRRYTALAAYSSAVRGYRHSRGDHRQGPFPPGPKILQKSAAQHLIMTDAREEDIEMLLGHYKARLKVTYYVRHWQRLREVAALLGLGPCGAPDGATPATPGTSR